MVCNERDCTPLALAAMNRTDTATIKLLAREYPAVLYTAHNAALEHNKNSTAVVSLLRECLAAWEHGNISALIDLCGESDLLLVDKEYVEEHPVHHAVEYASDIAILKPLIREHAPELLTEDADGDTPLDLAKRNPAVVSFMTCRSRQTRRFWERFT